MWRPLTRGSALGFSFTVTAAWISTSSYPEGSEERVNPIPIRVALPVADERELAARFGESFAPGGLRLPTNQPRKPGERLEVELTTRDGAVLFHALGVVARAVATPQGETALLIRFEELSGGQR